MGRQLEKDMAFQMLAAGNFPRHRTLGALRRRHRADFQTLFGEVVRLAQAADDAHGRQPGRDRNPRRGPPYKRAYGEPDAQV